MSDDRLDSICSEFEERFGEQGKQAADNLRHWLSGKVELAHAETIKAQLDDDNFELLFDCFWRELPFGTGGRRGNVGYGPNRINEATVALTVQGHCNFLRTADLLKDDTSVVVANDVRCFGDLSGTYKFLGDSDGDNPLLGLSSRSLARLACEIYAGNGVRAYITDPLDDSAVLTTPELSFAIRELGAAGGINVSASHNHPDDNGLKVYDSRGGQYVPPDDQTLADEMQDPGEIQRRPFAEGCDEGLIAAIPPEVHEAYLATYVSRYEKQFPGTDRGQPMVYTPLCGCGLTTVGEVLERLGFKFEVPPDQGPDGSFAAIPLRAPNPEVLDATTPAREFAEEQGATIVLSSDPDADRVGVDVLLDDGSWYHLTGNQIAAVLAYYLLLDPNGPQLRGLIVETSVTTRLLGAIAEEAGGCIVVDDLLVGFKYVAEVLRQLDESNRYESITAQSSDLVLAAEESHGVLTVPNIRDKDAVSGIMYLAGLHQAMAQEGRTLFDYLSDVMARFGPYGETGRSIVLKGNKGTKAMQGLMKSLRESPPDNIDGHDITEVIDHWDEDAFGPIVSDTDRESRNVLEWKGPGTVITIRPSGTEPKLKLYVQQTPDGEKAQPSGDENPVRAANARADDAALKVYRELLTRLDEHLSDAALLLPDIVSLQEKVRFDTEIVPGLWAVAREGKLGTFDEAAEWLRSETANFTSGADPLPALRDAVAQACRDRLEGPDLSDGESKAAEALSAWADRS